MNQKGEYFSFLKAARFGKVKWESGKMGGADACFPHDAMKNRLHTPYKNAENIVFLRGIGEKADVRRNNFAGQQSAGTATLRICGKDIVI